jgi:ATP phosphoribosyltransferase regulatory subunit
MTNRWLLPDHLSDFLPTQARQIEDLRRVLLDNAHLFGFELVAPPLVEHLNSLLIDSELHTASHALELQTFKLVDQLSGRTLGVRADTTPQVARIDAHLLNRQGLVRLCYCGPVLHTVPASPKASREPLQFGAEIYGHAGLEADLEVIQVAIQSLELSGIHDWMIDLSDVRIANDLMEKVLATSPEQNLDSASIHEALATKDDTQLQAFPELISLLSLYGGLEVLQKARHILPKSAPVAAALDHLERLTQHLIDGGLSRERISIDLSDLGGYGYYTGIRFALYSQSANEALARGGRYDDVGAVFGRHRPAVGFSLDIKMLMESLQPRAPKPAIRAPWRTDTQLAKVVQSLRERGEVVVCILPGHESEADEFACDRELVLVDGQWVIQTISYFESKS